MYELSPEILTALLGASITTAFFLLLLMGYVAASLRQGNRERESLHREMHGILRKLDAITSEKRELFAKEFDQIIETLSVRVPAVVASEAGERIFEAESKILSRLSKLEGDVTAGSDEQKDMEDLIKSMEKLDTELVSAASDAVHDVLIESRERFFSDYRDLEAS